MSQEIIISRAKKFIHVANIVELKTLLTSKDEQPTTETLNNILEYAIQRTNHDAIKLICALDISNELSQELIDKVFSEFGYLEEMRQFICETSLVKPSQKIIETTIDEELNKTYIPWVKISYLCSLKSANKPSQNIIQKVIITASKKQEWDRVKTLCMLTEDNKPTQNTIDTVFKECVRLSEVIFFFEKSATKPSQEAIDTFIESILKDSSLKWDHLTYLCALNLPATQAIPVDEVAQKPISHQPSQAIIDRVIFKAADNYQWKLVHQLSQMETVNKPSQEAIDKTFHEIKPLDELTFFCYHSHTKPSQNAIDRYIEIELGQTYGIAWGKIAYLCFLNFSDNPAIEPNPVPEKDAEVTSNQSSQAVIDKVIVQAANKYQWDLVYQLTQMIMANKPSQKAIDQAFQEIGPLNVLTRFCNYSFTKPSQKAIDLYIEKQLAKTFDIAWDKIAYLSFLNFPDTPAIGPNPIVGIGAKVTSHQPSQAVIDKTIVKAADKCQWELVLKLAQMTTVNKPRQEAIDKAFLEISPLDQLTNFCNHSRTKPSQNAINLYIEKQLAKTFDIAWDKIAYLSFLNFPDTPAVGPNPVAGIEAKATSHQPSQAVIDKTIVKAADKCQWELVHRLSQMKTANRPSQEGIDMAFKEIGPLDELKLFCDSELSLTKPSLQAIDNKIVSLLKTKEWAKLEFLCFTSAGKNGPNQTTIDALIQIASYNSQWSFVDKIIVRDFKTSKTLSQEALEYVLREASSSNKMSIITNICNFESARAPRQTAIKDALMNAAQYGHIDPMLFFSQMTTKLRPCEGDFDRAYILGVQYGKLNIVKHFCESKPHLKQEAFLTAVDNRKLHVIKFLLSNKNTQPNQESVNKAFLRVVENDSLEMVEYFLQSEHVSLEQSILDQALELSVELSKKYGHKSDITKLLIESKRCSQEAVNKVAEASTIATAEVKRSVVTHPSPIRSNPNHVSKKEDEPRRVAKLKQDFDHVPLVVNTKNKTASVKTEVTDESSPSLSVGFEVLSGFIAVLGVAAVATALILGLALSILSPPVFGIVLGCGIAAVAGGGIGFFATRCYNSQANDESLSLNPM